MIEKAHLSDNRVTHVSKSSTHNMAAKSSWHRYGNKLRHCHTHRTILSVRLYVPARAHSSRSAAEGLLLWARPAGNIDRLLHGAQQRDVRRAIPNLYAGSAMLSAYV